MHIDYIIYIQDIPRECVEDCSGPGPADGAVAYWLEELKFSVNRERAIDCLRGYGAWEPEELLDASDETLASRVLWLACGNFSEYITAAERAGIDPYGDMPDAFEPNAGSDIFVLEC
jgi:hypothetical protein